MNSHRTPNAKQHQPINATTPRPTQVQTPTSAAVTPSTNATPTTTPARAGLSSRVQGMKFMQRAVEGVVRAGLEKERTKEQQAQQWTMPTTPMTPQTPHSVNASPFTTPSASTTANTGASFSRSPFEPPPFLPRPPTSSAMFIEEEDTSATPSLPYSAFASLPQPPSTASAVPPPFIPGRRSYGQFNQTVDALVKEAQVLSQQIQKGEKQDQREKKYSVSDHEMADHYVGLRGKGAQLKVNGGGGGGGNSSRGGPQNTTGQGKKHYLKRHKRDGDEDGNPHHPQKKHKSSHKSANSNKKQKH